MRTLSVFILSAYSFVLLGQETYPCFSVIDSFSINSTLQIGTTIWLVEDQIWIDEQEHPTSFMDVFHFQKRIKLESYFKCSYTFDLFSESGQFTSSRVQLANGGVMYLVQETHNAVSYCIYLGEQYLIRPCDNEQQCITDKFIQSEITEQIISFSLRPDEVFIVNNPAEFGTYTEQVLEHDAYNDFIITQATFDTTYYAFVAEENNSCQTDTNLVYVEDSILIKEAYDSLVIVPPVFETVTEQVLKKEGSAYYNVRERELVDSILEIVLLPEYNILIWDTISKCISDEPIDCLRLDTIAIAESKIEIDAIIAKDCATSETPCGEYCLKFVEIPATYVTRQYTRLVTPSVIEAISIPAQYYYYTRQELGDTVPDSCIHYTMDTVSVLQLSNAAIVEDLEIPAEYSTRTFERVETPAFFEKEILQSYNSTIKGYALQQSLASEEQLYICEQFLDDSFRQKIINRFIQLGFLSQQTDFGSSLFWKAVFDFQNDQDLPLGKIDLLMINSLGIE